VALLPVRAKYEMVAISAKVSENGELPEHLRRIWPDAGFPARPNLRLDINRAASIGAATLICYAEQRQSTKVAGVRAGMRRDKGLTRLETRSEEVSRCTFKS
jgi:hypothetical protein